MDKLIAEVRDLLKDVAPDSYVRSTCPNCFGLPMISGNHRCAEGWARVKTQKAKDIAQSMKKTYEDYEKIKKDFGHNNVIDN